MIATTTAEVSAAAAPWAKRAPISIASLWARPQIIEATTKEARPMRKMRLRPKRSPSRPASSSRLPKVIR